MSYHQGMPFCAKTTAVSSRSSGLQAGGERADAGRLQRADDEILRAERGRVVGRLHVGLEFGVANAKRQAVCLDGIEMRPAHHAGHFVPDSASRTAKWLPTAPAPKMHMRMELFSCEGISGRRRQFPQACAAAQPCGLRRRPGRKGWINPRRLRLWSAIRKFARRNSQCPPIQFSGTSMHAGSPPSR